MTSRNPDNFDLSRACWRCQHFGAFVAEVHASCTRPGASLEASPATGCAYWQADPGNSQPLDWMPDGFRLTEKRMIWGNPPSTPGIEPDWRSQRPGLPGDAAKWDREQERLAWRSTDAVMSRFRGPARSGAPAPARVRIWPANLQPHRSGPDDQPADFPA